MKHLQQLIKISNLASAYTTMRLRVQSSIQSQEPPVRLTFELHLLSPAAQWQDREVLSDVPEWGGVRSPTRGRGLIQICGVGSKSIWFVCLPIPSHHVCHSILPKKHLYAAKLKKTIHQEMPQTCPAKDT